MCSLCKNNLGVSRVFLQRRMEVGFWMSCILMREYLKSDGGKGWDDADEETQQSKSHLGL
jgi:hypothetical protein